MAFIGSTHTPSYRLHKPSGKAVVTLNGRDVYLGVYGTPESQAEYRRVIAEWLAGGRHGPVGERPTVAVIMARYIGHAETYYVDASGKPTSELDATRVALRRLKDLYAATAAADFGPKSLEALRSTWIQDGLSRTTINHYVAIIRRMFRWATAQELVPASVHHGLTALPGLRRGRSAAREPVPVKPVPEPYVDAIRPHVSRQVWGMVELQRLTGMRPGEVIIMRGRDIDMRGDLWTYSPSTHKTDWRGHSRTVMLGKRAQAIVRAFLTADLDRYLFRPCDAEAERRAAMHAARNTPLTYGNRPGTNRKRRPRRTPGEVYSSCSYRRAIQRGVEAANDVERQQAAEQGRKPNIIPVWHPHQLRHNHATMVRRMFGIEAAKIALGHSTLDATQIYAERDSEVAMRIARDVG